MSNFQNLYPNHDYLHKFGATPGIGAGGSNLDVWDVGTAYTFPSANATTTVVSDDVNDTSEGTGAQTVVVIGIVKDGDGNYVETMETVTLNGTSTVETTNDFFRVYRAYIDDVGTGLVNAGNIDVKHGATVLARITAARGQTLMSIYTIPDTSLNGTPYLNGKVIQWYANAGAVKDASAVLGLQTRAEGKGWRTQRVATVAETPFTLEEPSFLELAPRTDVRVRIFSNVTVNTEITSGMSVALEVDSQYD